MILNNDVLERLIREAKGESTLPVPNIDVLRALSSTNLTLRLLGELVASKRGIQLVQVG